MSQVYLRSGIAFTPANSEQLSMQAELPAGTYTVVATPKGYHLELIEDFVMPSKMYGDTAQKAERILSTFLARPASTGVLLEGPKGSGKTVLSKLLSSNARKELGIITIVINQALYGEGFNSFLQAIAQPTIVIFDEFEKVYDSKEQSQLLTIFDGVYASKKLFILTCNDKYRVDSFMHNRPGRIYYSLSFKGVGVDFVTEYCEDNLLNKENMNGVIVVSGFFSEFSFDMLKALVEEMNRYGETATQAMSMLNIKPEADTSGVYQGKVMRNGEEVIYDTLHGSLTRESPIKGGITLYGEYDDIAGDDIDDIFAESKNSEAFPIDVSKLIKVDPAAGLFIFSTDKEDTTVVFTRQEPKKRHFNYDAL